MLSVVDVNTIEIHSNHRNCCVVVNYRCYNKSLEMLRHKVTSTDVQRIRIQEVRTTYRQSDVPKYSDDTIKNHQRPIDNNISSQQSFNHNSNSTHRNRHTPKRSRIDQNDSTQDVTSALPDLHNSADIESSFMSRTFEVEIRGSYINSCIPGDIVNIIGIVKTTNVSLLFQFGIKTFIIIHFCSTTIK